MEDLKQTPFDAVVNMDDLKQPSSDALVGNEDAYDVSRLRTKYLASVFFNVKTKSV